MRSGMMKDPSPLATYQAKEQKHQQQASHAITIASTEYDTSPSTIHPRHPAATRTREGATTYERAVVSLASVD